LYNNLFGEILVVIYIHSVILTILTIKLLIIIKQNRFTNIIFIYV